MNAFIRSPFGRRVLAGVVVWIALTAAGMAYLWRLTRDAPDLEPAPPVTPDADGGSARALGTDAGAGTKQAWPRPWPPPDETVTITEEHLALLRTAVVVWVNEERGAPYVTSFPGRDASYERLGESVWHAFAILLKFGQLEPGDYLYANPHEASDAGAWVVDADGKGRIPVPTEHEVRFQMTTEHLRLLHAAQPRGLGIDGKRPYGHRTCLEVDVGELLGIAPNYATDRCSEAYSKEEMRRFNALHESMVFALQTYLAYAKLKPGTFTRSPGGIGKWVRVK